MNPRKLSEEQLNDLVACLFHEFESKHGANTSMLEKHEFLLTDRDSCAKKSKLNSMQTATAADGQIVQMHTSSYVVAVETLKQRGLAKVAKSSPLAFTLTLQGYEHARQRLQQHTPSFLQRIQKTLNDHSGLIAVIAIIVGVVTAWWFSSSPQNP